MNNYCEYIQENFTFIVFDINNKNVKQYLLHLMKLQESK
jgi:hypothetical protein